MKWDEIMKKLLFIVTFITVYFISISISYSANFDFLKQAWSQNWAGYGVDNVKQPNSENYRITISGTLTTVASADKVFVWDLSSNKFKLITYTDFTTGISGDVSASGTPVATQLSEWTDATTVKGSRFWKATALTGGAAGALDDILIAGLSEGDYAITTTISGATVTVYMHIFDASSTTAENSPTAIRPDDYATAGVWLLAIQNIGGLEGVGDITASGTITGLSKQGADITGAVAHNTTDLFGVMYRFTAAATVTLDAAADVGFVGCANYWIRDAAEAAIIDLQVGEVMNLNGVPQAAGVGITATGVGESVTVCTDTDADGGGTDGYSTRGATSGWASQ